MTAAKMPAAMTPAAPDTAHPDPEAFFSLRGLRKSLGGREILRGINLNIRRGENLVLLGSSGGGKSVLLKHLGTLMQADSGELWIDGQEVTHATERRLSPTRLKIGMMFQDGALFDSLTVAENVGFPLLERSRRPPKHLAQRVAEALERVGLADQGEKMPVDLSGGMRKRAALARTLISEPRAILYDEPTSGLDPVATRRIDELIRRTGEQNRVTSVVITHDLESAWRMADRVAFLSGGLVRWLGTPKEMQGTNLPWLRSFLEGDHEGREDAGKTPAQPPTAV